jgi:hypothetical protein
MLAEIDQNLEDEEISRDVSFLAEAILVQAAMTAAKSQLYRFSAEAERRQVNIPDRRPSRA